MTEKTENLVLELLRAIGSDISDIKQDLREMALIVVAASIGKNEVLQGWSRTARRARNQDI